MTIAILKDDTYNDNDHEIINNNRIAMAMLLSHVF